MAERKHEQGTALIIALLVMVIMTLLGIPFLLMGETENRIAENERLSLQAQYAAEAGARMVRRWFDQPTSPLNAIEPTLAAIDRSQRLIDDDTDPTTDPLAADGSADLPYYKQDDDAIFEQPYRGSLVNALVGSEEGPDMRIARGDSPEAESFLDALSQRLFQGYLDAGGTSLRITRIDVFAPPLAQRAGDWVRLGVGTVKVEAGVYLPLPGGGTRTLAHHTVRFVFNEIPYQNEKLGVLHTCGTLHYEQNFRPRWGVVTAKGVFEIDSHRRIPPGIPRLHNESLIVDSLWPGAEDVISATPKNLFDDYYDSIAVDGELVGDPWFRVIAGGSIPFAPNGDEQPWEFEWLSGPLEDGQFTDHVDDEAGDAAAACLALSLPECEGSHSGVMQNISDIGCPDYPYDVWKAIALRGGPTIHYFAWDAVEGKFRENGSGAPITFHTATHGQTGYFFFDTVDGLPPAGINLTPAINIEEDPWNVTGVVYLNAVSFRVDDAPGAVIDYLPPGEPFLDLMESGSLNDRYDPGEPYVNLVYPTTLKGTGSAIRIDRFDDWNESGPAVVKRNTRGPAISAQANVYGILYNSGKISSNGQGWYYGSLISGEGFEKIGTASDGPYAFWDASMRDGEWPPPEWGLPRIVVTRWETGT